MFHTLYYNKIYCPLWGVVTINKAVNNDYQTLRAINEENKFFVLFEELKASHFKLGYKEYYPNTKAEDYVNSIFGNYLLKDIKADHFIKIEKDICFNLINNYLLENFISTSISPLQRDDFKKNVMASVDFATQNATDFFQFIPNKTLLTIIPDTGGPYDHFAAFIILNDEIIEDRHFASVTLMKFFRD